MKKLDRRLFRMIKATKGQYVAVLSIIFTGIFVFTAISNSAVNLKDSMDVYYKETNFADIFIKGSGITESLVNRLYSEDGIKEAEARIVFDTSFITDDKDEKVTVRAVSVDKYENKINKLFMKSGKRELTENDVILIEQFAIARKINIGDEIRVKINGRQYKFNVSGIASSPEYIYMMESEENFLPDSGNFGVIFLEKNYLRKIYGGGSFNEILLKVNADADIGKVADHLDDSLDKYGVRRVIKKEDQLSNNMMNQEISGLELMSQSMPFVFLTFAGIMLATMLSRIVKKDRMSIGVLKAMGFTESEILVHYLKYAASVGIIGGLIGSLTGTAASGFMTSFYLEFFNIPMLTVKIYYYKILISVVLSLLFCVSSGFWGVRGVVKINPAESMKPEAPKKGKKIFIENIKFLWGNIPFSWKIVLRNILREKKKFIFIGAAVAITCGMMVMTTWMIDVVDAMFNRHYEEFNKIQYNVSFDRFRDDSTINKLLSYIDVKHIEGRIEAPFEISNGRKSKIVNVIGLHDNTEFYKFRDEEGAEVTLPETGILISSNLARALDARIGDKILIDSFYDDKDVFVVVKGVINQTLGINGYMNIDYMNGMFFDKGIINGAYINSEDDVVKKSDEMKYISVQSQDSMRKAFEEYTAITSMSMGFMVLFSGFLGFIIVYSMTLMSINERMLEFSSLRVMGFTKMEIFNMLVRENMIMTVIGIAAGVPIGFRLVAYMGKSFTTDVYTMNEPVKLNGILISAVLTIVFIMLAQLMTYAKINKLNFMQALKSRIS